MGLNIRDFRQFNPAIELNSTDNIQGQKNEYYI